MMSHLYSNVHHVQHPKKFTGVPSLPGFYPLLKTSTTTAPLRIRRTIRGPELRDRRELERESGADRAALGGHFESIRPRIKKHIETPCSLSSAPKTPCSIGTGSH